MKNTADTRQEPEISDRIGLSSTTSTNSVLRPPQTASTHRLQGTSVSTNAFDSSLLFRESLTYHLEVNK